jgi:hypothetical protein
MLEFARWIELSIVVLLSSGEIKVQLADRRSAPVTMGRPLRHGRAIARAIGISLMARPMRHWLFP